MLFAAVLVLALLLHILIGWQWTILAGVVYGFLGPRLVWLHAALACGLAWTLLVLWNYAVAPLETGRMTETVGGLFGNIAPSAVVALTILLCALCGLIGALIGRRLHLIFRRPTRRPSAPQMPDLSFLKTPPTRD